jgi:hypothetical protein
MQNNVSSFYSLANNLQYFGSPSHMPTDREISHDTTSCLKNYSQPSYVVPYVTNFSAPYATSNIHYSPAHLPNTYGRISENPIEAHVPSSNTVAYDTPHKHLQNFGNTQVSLPKIIERSEERSSKEWAEDLVEKVLEAIDIQRKNGDSISTANLAKAALDNTCVGSNQQEENIAEPSSVEKHQSEEAQDTEKEKDKILEDNQQVEQDIVQVVQPPCSPNMINFDKRNMLIQSDQTGSARGKNIVVDDSAPARMIESKNSKVGVQKINERKRKSTPKLKPTVKQLLDKYTSCKANNVFSRLGGAKRHRSPRPGGHKHWRGKSYDQQPYFVMEPTYWSCVPPTYQQYPPWGFNHLAPYPRGPSAIF